MSTVEMSTVEMSTVCSHKLMVFIKLYDIYRVLWNICGPLIDRIINRTGQCNP